MKLLDVFGRKCYIRANKATVEAVIKSTGALRALKMAGDRISYYDLQRLGVANPNLETIWFGEVFYFRKNATWYSNEYMSDIFLAFWRKCKLLKTISFADAPSDTCLLRWVSEEVRTTLRRQNVSVRVNGREQL